MALSGSFARRLLSWYDRDRRDLPWRGQTDPYRIWISEAMLQQTVVATVIPYYHRFLERFPTVAALAAAAEADVMHAWAGLGYYSRARALKRAAETIMTEHGGALPDEEIVLRTLPGVGPYTAAAVASIAFGKVAFALDGNAARVMARVMAHEGPLEDLATKRALHDFGLKLVPRDRPGDFAQAVMELGARVCVPRVPACASCPIAPSCEARARGRAADLPNRRPRRAKKRVELICVALEAEGRVLLERRPAAGLLGGTWCLPSAELTEPKTIEETAAAIAREQGVRQLQSLHVVPGAVRHVFTHLDVRAKVVRLESSRPSSRISRESERRAWVDPAATGSVAVASFTRKLLAHLCAAQPSAALNV